MLPLAAFVSSFALLGWIGGHELAYHVVEHNAGHRHLHAHAHHGYLEQVPALGLVALLGAYALLLMGLYSRLGSMATWLTDAGASGARSQRILAAATPAAVFVIAEFAERAHHGFVVPPLELLAIGVIVQALLGLAVLAGILFALRCAIAFVHALHAQRRARRPRHAPQQKPSCDVPVRIGSVLATRSAGRAPPRVAA